MSRWNTEYRSLKPGARAAVNDLVNRIFSKETGVIGKIDPETQPELAAKWIAIRDRVLSNRYDFARWLDDAVAGVKDLAKGLAIYSGTDSSPEWIRVARGELGTMEIAGKTHNPRIMQYIRTCDNIQETEAQRKYVEREGEEGVEWCSAFVNWCLAQAGIKGTNHALASSWKNWGKELTKPQQGAIVCFTWPGSTRLDHVAFCDEVDGEFRMLGGNQTQKGGGGQVSSVRLSTGSAKHYRWPDA